MYYGYDKNTKHLFCFDNPNYFYLGKYELNNLPEEIKNVGDFNIIGVGGNDFLKCDDPTAVWTSCWLLSGFQDPCSLSIYLHENGDIQTAFVMKDGKNISYAEVQPTIELFAKKFEGMPICIGGEGCRDPKLVSDASAKFQTNPLFISHLAEADKAFGALIMQLSKHMYVHRKRVNLMADNEDELLDVAYMEIAANIEHDICGQMAQAIHYSGGIINEMCRPVGISPFYGRVLLHKHVNKPCVYLIDQNHMDGLFPEAPIALKHKAAQYVPVLMDNSDKFRKKTGWDQDKVIVRVLTHKDGEMVLAFCRFIFQFLQQPYVVSMSVSDVDIPETVLVARRRKIHRVTKSSLSERYNIKIHG